MKDEWKVPEIIIPPKKDRTMPQISLSLIPVSGKDSPIKTLNYEQGIWKEESEEYNALDKMKDFAEKAAFDLPKRPNDKIYDISLVSAADKARKKELTQPVGDNNIEKLINSYSRISEFINGCDWSKNSDKQDPKIIEQKYLDAKNEFMSQNLMLMPKDQKKDIIDLSTDDDILMDINKKMSQGTFSVGKDGALSISVQPFTKDVFSPVRRIEIN